MSDAPAYTEDRLLGGRVVLRQPVRGLRAGLDAVLLAAAIPARPGETVLEAGCGSGAAFLCLAARVSGLGIRAVERDGALAALAAANAAANGCPAPVVVGDVRDVVLARALGAVHHAFANPPWWPGGTKPPESVRGAATHEGAATLDDWAGFLAAALRPGGTASLLLPAARLQAGIAALMAARCGSLRLVPYWPRAGVPAKRVLLQARFMGRGSARLEPGLVLHDDAGWTAEAHAVLREAASYPG